MAIRQAKYIDITSGVGGRSAVSDRELIARVFTTSEKIGVNHIIEFYDSDSVKDWFGGDSAEYGFAQKYFSFVSKSVTKAKKISYFRWCSSATNAYVTGRVQADTTLSNYSGAMSLKLNVDGDTTTIPVTFSSPATMTAVLSAVTTALTTKGYTGASAQAVDSTGYVKIDLGATVTGRVIGFEKVGGADLATLLGVCVEQCPTVSDASAAEDPKDALVRSDRLNDNCGSLIILDPSIAGDPPSDNFGGITDDQAAECATWNEGKNGKYLLILVAEGYTNNTGGLSGNVTTLAANNSIKSKLWTCVWSYKYPSDYIAAMPAALFATTDYSRTNSTKSFMYQQNDSITAAITNDATSTTLDNANVNYMGVTQFAGGLIQFTQDGVCTDGTEIGVACNEIWLKSRFWAEIMNLFLALDKVPANEDGTGLVKTVMMPVIDMAIRNGTISPRKTLTTAQKVYIGQQTGDPDAWKDVYNNGYTLDIRVENRNGKYVATYVLIYSKGDSIRKVEGADIMI